MTRKTIRTASLAAFTLFAGLVTTGCAPSFKLKDPPPGYIEVSDYEGWDHSRQIHMKAPDNVGLNIRTFTNSEGGSLPLWSVDLVKKLGQRGYALTGQKPITSANGVAGTRFDFRYTPVGVTDAKEKFYTALLFVSDEWIVIAQLAGNAELMAEHEKDIDALLAELKIKGCKLGEDTCDGPQPEQLSTPAPAKLAGEDEAKPEDKPADKPEDKPEDKPADAIAPAPAG